MATVLPIVQPTHIVNIQSYNPIDSGVLMGVDVTINDLLGTQIAIIETSRGLQGFPGPSGIQGPPGSGFKYIIDANNTGNYIEAGISGNLFLNSSGLIELSFDNETKSLTIGASSSGLQVFSIFGGTP